MFHFDNSFNGSEWNLNKSKNYLFEVPIIKTIKILVLKSFFTLPYPRVLYK